MQLSFAPLEGITNYHYRNIHAQYFGGADRYFTPFLAPNQTKKFSSREKNDVLPQHNAGLHVIPQLLTNDVEYCLWAMGVLYEMGYPEINLNFGCPSGTVITKRKGAGFLQDLVVLDRFLDQVCHQFTGKVSVKTRLGLDDPQEFESILEVYNAYPLSEVIIHARVQKDFYTGKPDWKAFGQALSHCKHPVCYNGDIFTIADYQNFCKTFPNVEKIMLGRGWIANPDLGNQIRKQPKMNKQSLREFHNALYQTYQQNLSGQVPVLFKMKELWFYLHCLFDQSERVLKKIRKTKHLSEYESALEEMFACSFQPQAGYQPALP